MDDETQRDDDMRSEQVTLERVGVITHFWRRAGAAEVALDGRSLRVGDVVLIRSGAGDRGFVQEVFSLEVDRVSCVAAGPGEPVAMGVLRPVQERDEVFRVPRGVPLESVLGRGEGAGGGRLLRGLRGGS